MHYSGCRQHDPVQFWVLIYLLAMKTPVSTARRLFVGHYAAMNAVAIQSVHAIHDTCNYMYVHVYEPPHYGYKYMYMYM